MAKKELAEGNRAYLRGEKRVSRAAEDVVIVGGGMEWSASGGRRDGRPKRRWRCREASRLWRSRPVFRTQATLAVQRSCRLNLAQSHITQAYAVTHGTETIRVISYYPYSTVTALYPDAK